MNSNPRKPAFALVMSLVLPGWGQLYNGEMNKAIWLFLAFAVLSAPVLVLIALHLPDALMMPTLLLALAATLGIWLYGLVDAWRGARRRQDYVAAPWQVSGAYALVFIVCNVLVLPMLIAYVHAHQVESFRIPSGSMLPGIEPGDFIFADKRYNCPGCKQGVRRGDIAIFVYPNDRTLNYIKRIIGLPGDHIRIAGTEVWVNDKPLTPQSRQDADGNLVSEGDGDRRWRVRWTKGVATQTDVTVPPGQVFVLGDNRDATVDSRQFGTVPLQDVVGLARQIWFSYAGGGNVRWERLGQVLQ